MVQVPLTSSSYDFITLKHFVTRSYKLLKVPHYALIFVPFYNILSDPDRPILFAVNAMFPYTIYVLPSGQETKLHIDYT
jgi:hypothetical protein